MQDGRSHEWQELVRSHIQLLQNCAMVGNVTDAVRALEAIGDVIEAAVATSQAPGVTQVNVRALAAKVRPYIVLRQARTAADVVESALRDARVLPARTLSHVAYFTCPPAA